MSSRLIPLAWALAGKLPGDKADYRLLASSAPAGDRGALADQVWAAVPSIPQLATLPGPGGLPWVTVIPGEQAGEDNELHEGLHWLAVTVTEATADTDAVGRPSVAIRHIRLSYPDVAGALAGYQALHAAVPPAAELTVPPVVTLTAHGGEPDLASGAAFDRAAGLAALLLDGDVMITVADGTSLPVPARLAEFDRIMALHPYGLRACMTMATWYDGTVRDGGLPGEVDTVGYRLAYGPFSTHGQAVATSGGRVPPPVAETAIAYLAELRAAREELGSRLLMKYLAAHRTVLAPGNGEQVLDILRALRDPSRVLTAIREGRATVEHARNARQFAAGRLHPEERDALDEYLLAQADPATITDLLSTWSERSAALAARALLGLPTGTGQPASRARQFYAAAARVGKAEAFLLALARSCISSEMGSPQRMLAAYYITELISPESGGMSALRAEVWQEPWLTRELLRLSLSRDPVDQAWLEWLAPGPGQDALQWLPGYSMLIRREDGDPEVSQLRAARLDTLRLYVGLPAIGLPLTGPILATTQYLNALWALWAQPPIDADQAGLIARLLEGIHERLREEPPGRLTETAVVAVLCAAVADDWVPLDARIDGQPWAGRELVGARRASPRRCPRASSATAGSGQGFWRFPGHDRPQNGRGGRQRRATGNANRPGQARTQDAAVG